jgi:hypothetical protein
LSRLIQLKGEELIPQRFGVVIDCHWAGPHDNDNRHQNRPDPSPAVQVSRNSGIRCQTQCSATSVMTFERVTKGLFLRVSHVIREAGVTRDWVMLLCLAASRTARTRSPRWRHSAQLASPQVHTVPYSWPPTQKPMSPHDLDRRVIRPLPKFAIFSRLKGEGKYRPSCTTRSPGRATW